MPKTLCFLLFTLAPLPAAAADPALGGMTGLVTVPTAEVQPEGSVRLGYSRHNLKPGHRTDSDNFFVTVGFLPGLEFAGRLAEDVDPSGDYRDLSFDAKYAYWGLPGGFGIAAGAQDIGGEAQNFRSKYLVATLPWHALNLSLGYGLGPDVLDGPFGGIEFRPWPYFGMLAEYDAEEFNAGVRLSSGALLGPVRLGAMAAYRAANEEVEYGAQLDVPLGRASHQAVAVSASAAPVPTPGPAPELAPRAAAPSYESPALRQALTALGFERVRVGLRPPATQVVLLENRSYNHSSADGIGLALGVIAKHADPAIERIELTLLSYGMAQVMVAVPAGLYRAFLDDPATATPGLLAALEIRSVDRVENATAIIWDPAPTPALSGIEVMVEPVVRTFIGTEYGAMDYGIGVRARFTVPLRAGLLLHAGLQAPILLSNDFEEGMNFAASGPEAGVDLLMLQALQKINPQWTWLWSLGRLQVIQSDLNTLAQEQFWTSADGTHQLRAKLMALQTASSTRTVALAGYTWFDPVRDYSASLTAGRFYAGDWGWRVDLSRHFGDTTVGVLFKAASRDDQMVGLQISLPLTPRRDGRIKGPRRWSYATGSTVNAADQRNALRTLLLFEPQLDMDLRRDFHDSGRLGEAYLRDELPRMHEAYQLWGAGR